MLTGEKVLITGPAGRIAFGLARTLAADNEVWGIARFTDAASRAEVEQLGVTTRAYVLPSPTPCTVDWREGFRAMATSSFPDRVR